MYVVTAKRKSKYVRFDLFSHVSNVSYGCFQKLRISKDVNLINANNSSLSNLIAPLSGLKFYGLCMGFFFLFIFFIWLSSSWSWAAQWLTLLPHNMKALNSNHHLARAFMSKVSVVQPNTNPLCSSFLLHSTVSGVRWIGVSNLATDLNVGVTGHLSLYDSSASDCRPVQ